jgi:hypothetical protein
MGGVARNEGASALPSRRNRALDARRFAATDPLRYRSPQLVLRPASNRLRTNPTQPTVTTKSILIGCAASLIGCDSLDAYDVPL